MNQSRRTRQKEQLDIGSAAMAGFFSAEELHQRTQQKHPDIGIATVYRFLKESAKKGRLHSYQCGKRTIYSAHHQNHCHFICEKCGKTEHISVKNVDFLAKTIKGTICHFQVDIYGLCDACEVKKE